jgi:hypothetical protein
MIFSSSKKKSENVLEEGGPWESLEVKPRGVEVSRSMLFERML